MDINKVKEKLAALLARARDAGSSDAEIDACMARARKMMETYGLSEDDLESVTAESFKEYRSYVKPGKKTHSPVWRYCSVAIGRFTGTKPYVTKEEGHTGKKSPIVFFGLESDVELAVWLLNSLEAFMLDRWAMYKKTYRGPASELKAEMVGFIQQYCRTVSERLIDAAEFVHKPGSEEAKSTALVVKKSEVVQAEMARRGVHVGGRGANLGGGAHGSASGKSAGRAAGQAANIGRGVGQSRALLT